MIARQSPLNGINIGNIGTVAMRELPEPHTLDLRVEPQSTAQTAVARALLIELPLIPGQTSRATSDESDVNILCLAPDWWLITGLLSAGRKLGSLHLMGQYHFSAVDVSGQRTTIELEGPKVRELLAHLWEQDIREKNFPVGSVSQGLMAKAPVIVWHIAPFRYRVMVRSSFALHLWKALADAAAEWV